MNAVALSRHLVSEVGSWLIILLIVLAIVAAIRWRR